MKGSADASVVFDKVIDFPCHISVPAPRAHVPVSGGPGWVLLDVDNHPWINTWATIRVADGVVAGRHFALDLLNLYWETSQHSMFPSPLNQVPGGRGMTEVDCTESTLDL